MEFLAILAANKVLQGAAGLVNALKRPRVTKQEFSDMLRQEVQRSVSAEKSSKNANAFIKRATALSASYVAGRDKNRDGLLSLAETDMTGAQFAALDGNGDGQLSAEELRPFFVAAAKSAYSASPERK